MSDLIDVDWDPIRNLASRDKSGEPLVLTEEVLIILRRTAREVAIGDEEAESALRSTESATALLRKIMARIISGSQLLQPALHRMYQLREAGDFDGARQQMRDVLAVEVVPLYRDIAEGQIEELDGREAPGSPYSNVPSS